jgi:thiamine-phosphate pyrophosphorylase
VSSQRTARRIRGLYAVTPDESNTRVLVGKVAAAIAGGARFVQYRNKVASPALRLEQGSALKALCAQHGAALIVNDHVDIARAIEADGVHLGREDGCAALGRSAVGPDRLVGISCYQSLERARVAVDEGADHVAFGSFFPSRVKPGATRAPVDLLTQAKHELDVPIVAIGGITVENGGALVRAGADALAVISALFDAPDVTAAAAGFTALFDTPA